MNTKWIGKPAKINKLPKILIDQAKLKTALDKVPSQEVESLKNDLQFLEQEANQQSTKLLQVEDELAQTNARIVKLDSNDGTTTPKGLRYAYNDFKTNYKLVKNVNNWLKKPSGATGERNNKYGVNLPTGKIETTEDEVARIIATVAKQISTLNDTDFANKVDATIKTRATALLTTVKNNTKKMTKIGRSGGTQDKRTELWDFEHEFNLNYPLDSNGNPDYSQTPTGNITTQIFPYQAFFELMTLIAPPTDLTLIRKVNNKAAQNTIWTITPASNKALTKAQLETYYGGKVNEDTKLYLGGKISDAKTVSITGLEDWVNLFWMVLQEKSQRDKFLESCGQGGSAPTPSQPITKLVMDLTDHSTTNQFKNGDYYLTDVEVELQTERKRKLELEAKKKLFGENLSENSKVKTEKELAISQKLLPIDIEIQNLVEKELKEQQKKVDDFKLTDTNFDWTKDTNKLKGAYAKWLLANIKYLENEGDETKAFKKPENQTLWTIINRNLTDASALNTLIKTDWESKGVSTETRISKVKSETEGFGLGFYLNHFESSNDSQTIATAIKTALGQKDDAETLTTYQTMLKEFDPELETKFTKDLKTKWQSDEAKQFQNSTTLKSLLESIQNKDDFFTHIKGGTNGYEDTKDIDTWAKLLAQDPKVVITTIKRYEFDNLDDTGEDKEKKKTQQKRAIAKLLAKTSADNLTDAEINQVLYEVAIGTKTLTDKALKADLSEYAEKKEDEQKLPVKTPFWKSAWGITLWICLAVLVIGGGLSWAFWDKLKTWWEPKEEIEESEEDE